MSFAITITNRLNCFIASIRFFKNHFLVIFGLGLVAAFGRVIQLGGFGEISKPVNMLTEVFIEAARIAIFLYVLGLSSVKGGIFRLRRLITDKVNRKANWNEALRKIRNEWPSILLNLVAFFVMVGIINYLIDLLAYQTCFYLSLKNRGILTANSSEWTILLFFKNITVIPLTLTFEAILMLWIVNKFSVSAKVNEKPGPGN